jgi:hypothetical protein
MHRITTLRSLFSRETRSLGGYDDRLIEDIGLERRGDLITGPGGRLVHRVALPVGTGRALLAALPFVRIG